MHSRTPTLQRVLYPVFLITCAAAVVVSLMLIWGLGQPTTIGRLLGTFSVLALGSALTISTAKQVNGRMPLAGEDAG